MLKFNIGYVFSMFTFRMIFTVKIVRMPFVSIRGRALFSFTGMLVINALLPCETNKPRWMMTGTL